MILTDGNDPRYLKVATCSTGLPLHVKATTGAGTAVNTMTFVLGTLISICRVAQKMTPEQIVYSVRGISNFIEFWYDNLRIK